MARRNASSTPHLVLAPYVKTPLQIEQWAAYQVLTEKHNAEAKAKAELLRAATVVTGEAGILYASFFRWQQSENIPSFVAATMALMPSGANQSAIDTAIKRQAWALRVADENDSAMAQVKQFLLSADADNPN